VTEKTKLTIKQVVRKNIIQTKTFLIKRHATVISLVALSMAMYGIYGQQSLISDYQHSLTSLQYYDIRAELNIVYLDYTNTTILIPMSHEPDPSFNNDSTVNSWLYSFEHSEMDIDSSFRTIKLRISIPSKAFSHFSGVVSTWFVEDNTGTLTNGAFFESTITWGYYDAFYDISQFMWKADVPEQIEIKTTLYA